ncbi:hypothetical protein B0H16DRAFT_1466187 [Mycena metata]|uniref:Uncharacterized protein n=1 Tax=Mycena metata TaxID=1033252 RepID=A0AAD7IAD3_9AGAR|nr:hypothetical protein B0H16DRAFT_1466187 [Mycena metata]
MTSLALEGLRRDAAIEKALHSGNQRRRDAEKDWFEAQEESHEGMTRNLRRSGLVLRPRSELDVERGSSCRHGTPGGLGYDGLTTRRFGARRLTLGLWCPILTKGRADTQPQLRTSCVLPDEGGERWEWWTGKRKEAGDQQTSTFGAITTFFALVPSAATPHYFERCPKMLLKDIQDPAVYNDFTRVGVRTQKHRRMHVQFSQEQRLCSAGGVCPDENRWGATRHARWTQARCVILLASLARVTAEEGGTKPGPKLLNNSLLIAATFLKVELRLHQN